MKIYKNITIGIVFALSISLLISACDKIDMKDVHKEVTFNGSNQKVLIEEFTGHHCPNCPKAHKKIHELIEAYGDTNVFAVAIHAGSFATPSSAPFDYDFRTDVGNTYFNEFQPQGFPTGMVNRTMKDNNILQDVNSWDGLLGSIRERIAPMNIEVKVDEVGKQNTISGKVNLSFIKDFQEKAKLQIIVTEDSIIKAQEVAEKGGVVEDYVHMHVLRGAVNGNWGEALPNDSYAANETATISFNNYALGDDWAPKNLMILAYLYNADTKEVIQVNGTKVMP